MKIKKFFDDLFVKYYARKARRHLLSTKKEDLAVFMIMENYLIKEVMGGKTERREELLEIQKKIEEFEKFINFIKKIK